MPLPVTFATLPGGDNAATLLDEMFDALAGLTVIPCSCLGQNDLALQPFLDAPVVSAYSDLSPVFAFVAAETSTGNVTVNVDQLGEFPLYKDHGANLVAAEDIVQGLSYRIHYQASLRGGAGGLVVDITSTTPPPPSSPAPTPEPASTQSQQPAGSSSGSP